jgi:hypothetical protein
VYPTKVVSSFFNLKGLQGKLLMPDEKKLRRVLLTDIYADGAI